MLATSRNFYKIFHSTIRFRRHYDARLSTRQENFTLLKDIELLYVGILGSRKRTERLLADTFPIGFIHQSGFQYAQMTRGNRCQYRRRTHCHERRSESMKIVGIYLAAGKNSRMGQSKLALPVGTMTLGSLALQTALQTSLDKIHVIVKETDNVSWLPSEIRAHKNISIVQCPTAHDGQSESLRSGIKQAQANHADAIIIMLADQPFITALTIEEMITCMKETPARKFIATSHDGMITTPVLFSSAMYSALLSLTGDTGAKSLLQGELLRDGKQLSCSDKRLIFDVDTEEDFNKLLSILELKVPDSY